jgi:3-hydroxyisobutyrate dehydrogenase-like beta-hydroxyacid dehydrogenase
MMASGPEEGIAALQPLLPLFTRKFFYLGSQHGAAQMCKLVNNAIACVGMYAACEAIAAGLKAGLNDRTLLEVINASSGHDSLACESDKHAREVRREFRF